MLRGGVMSNRVARCGKCLNCCPKSNQPRLDCNEIKKNKKREKKRKQRLNKKLQSLTTDRIMEILQCEKDWASALCKKLQHHWNYEDAFWKFVTRQPTFKDYPDNCSFEEMTWTDLSNDMLRDDALEPIMGRCDADIKILSTNL